CGKLWIDVCDVAQRFEQTFGVRARQNDVAETVIFAWRAVGQIALDLSDCSRSACVVGQQFVEVVLAGNSINGLPKNGAKHQLQIFVGPFAHDASASLSFAVMIMRMIWNAFGGAPGNRSSIGSKPHFSRYRVIAALTSCRTVRRV